jgi:hypothetical protein
VALAQRLQRELGLSAGFPFASLVEVTPGLLAAALAIVGASLFPTFYLSGPCSDMAVTGWLPRHREWSCGSRSAAAPLLSNLEHE